MEDKKLEISQKWQKRLNNFKKSVGVIKLCHGTLFIFFLIMECCVMKHCGRVILKVVQR